MTARENSNAADIAIINARVLTCAGAPVRCGSAMNDLGSVTDAHVSVRDGRVLAVTRGQAPAAATVIDARGRVVMPGFVDCHTHACWAGDRLDEWAKRLSGVAYLDILAAGGGIMSTVRAVRAATPDQLAHTLDRNLAKAARQGTTTIEVKSGYGLSAEAELKMLRVIVAAGRTSPIRVVPTALLGHAIDPAQPDFAQQVITQTLAAVTSEFPGITVDAYCEKGAFDFGQSKSLFRAAHAAGHRCRVHADQFNDLGVIAAAREWNLVSVDHLEASSPQMLALLASTWTDGGRGVTGVGLPLCGMHMADGRYANLRTLVEAGGACAIATNCNPGSAPCISMPLAIAMAVRHCGLSPNQAILAATVNPAHVLGLPDTGRIEAGCRADIIMLDHADERALAYELDAGQVATVIAAGRLLPTV